MYFKKLGLRFSLFYILSPLLPPNSQSLELSGVVLPYWHWPCFLCLGDASCSYIVFFKRLLFTLPSPHCSPSYSSHPPTPPLKDPGEMESFALDSHWKVWRYLVLLFIIHISLKMILILTSETWFRDHLEPSLGPTIDEHIVLCDLFVNNVMSEAHCIASHFIKMLVVRVTQCDVTGVEYCPIGSPPSHTLPPWAGKLPFSREKLY